ncbi:hypothetical protein DF057_16730 [Burkholderia cepacia]|nr:hypothetical protein DF057_16730 [Burkholderia cepacia]
MLPFPHHACATGDGIAGMRRAEPARRLGRRVNHPVAGGCAAGSGRPSRVVPVGGVRGRGRRPAPQERVR